MHKGSVFVDIFVRKEVRSPEIFMLGTIWERSIVFDNKIILIYKICVIRILDWVAKGFQVVSTNIPLDPREIEDNSQFL